MSNKSLDEESCISLIVRLKPLVLIQSSEADINDDGFINIVDVVQLVNIILDI